MEALSVKRQQERCCLTWWKACSELSELGELFPEFVFQTLGVQQDREDGLGGAGVGDDLFREEHIGALGLLQCGAGVGL